MDESDPWAVSLTGISLGVAFFIGIILLMCRRKLKCCDDGKDGQKSFPKTKYTAKTCIVDTEQLPDNRTPVAKRRHSLPEGSTNMETFITLTPEGSTPLVKPTEPPPEGVVNPAFDGSCKDPEVKLTDSNWNTSPA